MNNEFFNINMKCSIIKKWVSSQVSLLTDDKGNRFIEKKENQVNCNGIVSIVPYGSDELEIYEEILNPLEIEHVSLIASERTKNHSKFILEYIDGITCSEAPEPQHLYDAATKVGKVYKSSKINMERLNKDVLEKYYLSSEKMIAHLKAFPPELETKELAAFIKKAYDKYEVYPLVLNHFDMHFKNMIATESNLVFIDWATAQICAFYSDLYILLRQAREVGADYGIIIENFRKPAGLSQVTQAEILEGAICWCIPAIHWLLDLRGTDNVPFYEWAVDEYQSAIEALKLYESLPD